LIYVLDACAMIAYLTGEPGGDRVDALLRDADHRCYAHSINLCEVYYDFIRRSDTARADEAIGDLRSAGVVERSDFDAEVWRPAGTIKAARRLSLADAVCISLAQRLGAQLVTSDHHEFDGVAADGVCPVLFIR
jgi:PIN domain nuclease of toxin-antitoxin system